ncbi:MAG: hypothetical protein CL610_19345 [Anaerolineaceae bacterium]|nr:hypothetical protein [Anaerolineaceae bacterium]
MRIQLVIGAAIVGMILILIVGRFLLQPDLPLITEAEFSPTTISPNADGEDDITLFQYSLSRNAQVSLVFESATGETYVFRQDEPRIQDDYQVNFSGVVDGYTLEGEDIAGEVLRRLIPNGDYTWRLTAVDAQTGAEDERTGTLIVQDADAALPRITSFSVWPDVFTPNQDGINDRTEISVYLEKGADLQVYLLGPEGEKIYVAERQESREPGEPGRHLFDYEGGVDLDADPPPDGAYTVVAHAQDDEGQVVQQTGQLVIENGGKPLAEIVPQTVGVDVVFTVQPYDERYFTSADASGDLIEPPDDVQDNSLTALQMPLGDMLVFKLTVENYGKAPIRTSGPPPGTVYQQTQRAATLNAFDEAGAWRVGIDCATAETDYPWRWGLGTGDAVYEEFDPYSGNTYTYISAGERVVVWGAIRMTEIEALNPQNCWAGLIHEFVEVSVRNTNVGSREVLLVDTSESGGGGE